MGRGWGGGCGFWGHVRGGRPWSCQYVEVEILSFNRQLGREIKKPVCFGSLAGHHIRIHISLGGFKLTILKIVYFEGINE